MFKDKHLEQLAKFLNLDKRTTILFAKRLHNWIKSNGAELPSIIKGMNVILKDLKIKHEKASKINLDGVKHKVVIKYAKEIIELANNGLGSRKISSYLLAKHNAKVSYFTIYKFLKQNEHLIIENDY